MSITPCEIKPVIDMKDKRAVVDTADQMISAHKKRKSDLGGELKENLVVQINDDSEGPTEISSYYIEIICGPGLTKSVYETFWQHFDNGKWMFEGVTSEAFCGLVDEDEENSDSLVADFALFIDTHMIPANRMGGGITKMPDFSRIKFLVNYSD